MLPASASTTALREFRAGAGETRAWPRDEMVRSPLSEWLTSVLAPISQQANKLLREAGFLNMAPQQQTPAAKTACNGGASGGTAWPRILPCTQSLQRMMQNGVSPLELLLLLPLAS